MRWEPLDNQTPALRWLAEGQLNVQNFTTETHPDEAQDAYTKHFFARRVRWGMADGPRSCRGGPDPGPQVERFRQRSSEAK